MGESSRVLEVLRGLCAKIPLLGEVKVVREALSDVRSRQRTLGGGPEGVLIPDLLGAFSHEEGIIHIFMDVIAKACSSIRVPMEALAALTLLHEAAHAALAYQLSCYRHYSQLKRSIPVRLDLEEAWCEYVVAEAVRTGRFKAFSIDVDIEASWEWSLALSPHLRPKPYSEYVVLAKLPLSSDRVMELFIDALFSGEADRLWFEIEHGLIPRRRSANKRCMLKPYSGEKCGVIVVGLD